MPTIPAQRNLTNSSVNILNAIRNSASINYRNYVPYATPDADSIRSIGAIIMDYPSIQNEFINTLVGRIGLVWIKSRSYENPWAFGKKGFLEFGETIEEIFVDIAKVQSYDPADAENTLYKRVIPDVKAAFHVVNYKKLYPVTIQNDSLRSAFLSWDGITDLIAKIVERMYTSMNYDEYQVMKYLVDRSLLNGQLHPITVTAENAESAKTNAATIKGISNQIEFMSPNYNIAGVYNHTPKDDQFLILDTRFDAVNDVEVLAASFNMDKAEFMGHRVLVDGFGTLDTARLAELFADDPNYEEIGKDDLNKLNNVSGVLIDRDWFMIFDQLMQFTENYNGKGLYWQYFLHTWKVFSVSPFANAIAFVTGTPSVTSVTVSPEEVTLAAGQTQQLSVNVVTEYFAPQSVTWTSNNENVTVDARGFVTVGTGASGTATITATSTYDTSKTGTATITIS